MKRFSLFAAVLAIAPILAAADPFYFVQISDTHQGPALHQWRFREAIRRIDAYEFPIECVAHTGDLSANGFSEYMGRTIPNILKLIRQPLVVCPGNHDLPLRKYDTEAKFLEMAATYRKTIGELGQAHESSNALYLAVCTETIRQDGAPQVPDFDPIDWLDKRLAQTPDKPAFIFTHVPDCEDFFDGTFYPGWSSETNRVAFRAMLAKHPNVKAVIGGHFHRPVYAQNPDGIPTFAGPCIASFWDRQGALRIYKYDNGCLSFQDVFLLDPAPETHINRDGIVVREEDEDKNGPEAPGDPEIPAGAVEKPAA